MIYRHPLGRFEVVETTGRNMFGDTYRMPHDLHELTREAVLTPERDVRGLLHEEDLIDAGWHKSKSGEPISDDEKARICRMYQDGATMQDIAARMGRGPDAVRKVLIKHDMQDYFEEAKQKGIDKTIKRIEEEQKCDIG